MEYKKYANKLNWLKNICKKNYFSQHFHLCKNNLKASWKLIGMLVKRKSKGQIPVSRLCSATRNGDVNNHIAEHHLKTKHQIDWDSATCITYSADYYQRLTLERWFTNLEQTPLNRSQQLPAPYKRLIDEIKQN